MFGGITRTSSMQCETGRQKKLKPQMHADKRSKYRCGALWLRLILYLCSSAVSKPFCYHLPNKPILRRLGRAQT
jgi:hypothetical protein